MMTDKQPSRTRNLSITGLTALTGCITLGVIAVALLTGLWLDNLIGRRGPATICMLLLSVPVSLYLMIRTALALIQRIELPAAAPGKKVSSLAEKEE
ncbi:MAG: hypothetical protein MUE40_03490 [Anaerolineae bacterium]|jgi:hypothetical protein|nr:hypothetical protein [Anaerolineae bacterium]